MMAKSTQVVPFAPDQVADRDTDPPEQPSQDLTVKDEPKVETMEEGEPIAATDTEATAGVPDNVKEENKLMRSEASRARIVQVLNLVLFLDFLGNSLMMSNSAYLFFPATENTTSKSDLDRKVGVFYQDGKDLGLDQATAQNLGSTLSTLAQAVAAFISGYIAQAIGRRGCLLLYTIGASGFFVLTYFTQDWGLLSYYGLRICTGLLAGSQPIVNSYVYDLYPDPAEAQRKASGVLGLIAIALAVGPMVGNAMGQTNLFIPFIVAGCLEFFGGIMLLVFVPRVIKRAEDSQDDAIPKSDAEDKAARESMANAAAKTAFKKRNYKRWMIVFWIARLFDRLGGNSMSHLVTYGMRSFDGWIFNNYTLIFLGFSLLVFIVIPVSLKMSKSLGFAFMPICTQFCAGLFTMGMSICWMNSNEVALYLLFFFGQAFFTTNAMMVVTPTVVALVPADMKTYWLGYMASYSSLTSAICPLLMSFLLDAEKCDTCTPSKDGSIPSGTFLFISAGFTLLSCVPYAMLIGQFPLPTKKKEEITPEEEEEQALVEQFWKDNNPENLRYVSFEKRNKVMRTLQTQGKTMPNVPWRPFAADMPDLDKIHYYGTQDLKVLLDMWEQNMYEYQYQSDGKEKFNRRMSMIKKEDIFTWSEDDRRKLGDWFAQWLEHAGYIRPSAFPRYFKNLMMTHFPNLTPEGMDRNDMRVNPIPFWKNYIRVSSGTLRLDKDNTEALQAAERFTFSNLKPPNLF